MIPPLSLTDVDTPLRHGDDRAGRVTPNAVVNAQLRAIVEPHFSSAWRTLRRFGVPSAALDDAMQQVLMVVAAKLHQIEPGKERAFLLGTAHGIAANFRRLHARRAEVALEETDSGSHAGPDPGPEELLELKHRRALLDEALDALPQDQRAVFVLYELEGCTMIEIAEVLSLPMGTVASRLRRGRARFEQKVLVLKRREEEGGR